MGEMDHPFRQTILCCWCGELYRTCTELIIFIGNSHFIGADTWLFHSISSSEKFVKFRVGDSRVRSATLNQNESTLLGSFYQSHLKYIQ